VKPDLNDYIAATGLIAATAGTWARFGWEVSAMLFGGVLLVIGVWRSL